MLLKTTLNSLSQLVGEHPELGFGDRLTLLCQERQYMLDFMRRGVQDDSRYDIYADLLRRSSVLLCDVQKAVMIHSNHYLASLQREHASGDVTTQQLIESLSDTSLSDDEHIHLLNHVFCCIMLQPSWKEGDSRLWLSYLVNDATPEFDACAVVSAIMMSAYLSFSFEKFRTLVITYQMVTSEEVRQRALLGFLICYDSTQEAFLEKQNELLQHLVNDRDDAAKECVKALMQMTNCSLTDKDTKDFQQHLAPRLYKAQMRQFSEMDNTLGRSSIDEILNPSKSEQEMADIEEDIRKLSDIQKKGVDLFFDGFSHMKRYPFFYKIVNWFVPFSASHPDIREAYSKMKDMKFFENSMSAGPFCASDKYSFVFAFSHVVNQLPENLLKMMNDGEVAVLGTELQGGLKRSATYVRRMVLQDLYRFFNLFPQYKFSNIFAGQLARVDSIIVELSKNDSDAFADYGRYLLRRGETERLSALLAKVSTDDASHRLLTALLDMKKGEYLSAYRLFKNIYKSDQSTSVLRNYALSAFNTGHFTVAAQLYHELKTAQPDNLSYQLHYILSEAKSGRADVVLNDIYRLEYEISESDGDAGNILSVRRVLAWVLLLCKKPEKADAVMQRILSADTSLVAPSDYLNASYGKLFIGDLTMALHYLSTYKRLTGYDNETLLATFREDTDMLTLYGITSLQLSLLLDALE